MGLKSKILKKAKMKASVTLLLLGVIATASNVALAKGPDADSCWRYTTGAHMTQGGSSDKDNCPEEQYCYVATKAKDNEGKQGLHATATEFVGGCAAPNDPILQGGINKDKLPSCSEKLHMGYDLICVCNEDDCNNKDQIPAMKQKSQSLGSFQNGSENVGYSLFLTLTAFLATMFFRV